MSTGIRSRQRSGGFGIVGLDHVQLAMPAGEEPLARLFYAGLLGLTEVAKPRQLAVRGGCWFNGEGVSIHLGVEPAFTPTDRAHLALLVGDLARARERLAEAGVDVEDDDSGLAIRRCYIRDPFGNRIELVDAADAGFSRRRPRRSPRPRTVP
jgi:catechol 2,3-dioxygenase-like lactoylglutathione lyase family enzyme